MSATGLRAGTAVRDATRDRILTAALLLMGDHGFAATSTREVCEQMGFTKAALYYHFPSKDDLLAELIAPMVADLRDLLPEGGLAATAPARRQVLTAYIDLVLTHADLIRVLYEDPSVRHHPVLTDARTTYHDLVRALTGGQPDDDTTQIRARAALGAVHAALLRAQPDERRATLRAATLAAACGALGIPSPRHP